VDLQQELEWALQRQNFRFAEAVRKRHLPMKVRRVVGACVSVIGLVAGGVLLSHGWYPTLAAIVMPLFVGTLLLSIYMPQFHAWSRRAVGRSITRRAARLMPHLQREPAALPPAALALSTPNLVVLFSSTHAQNPLRIVQVTDDDREAAIATATTREHLTGAVEGYFDPLPVAKVRR
jgi:hypothetical protein